MLCRVVPAIVTFILAEQDPPAPAGRAGSGPEDYTPDPVPIASGLVRLRRRPDQRSEKLSVRFASKNELIAGARRAARGNGDKECQRTAGNATHLGRRAGLSIV